VVYEAGKCIKCGICVRIAATAEDGLGLAFTGRGFGTVMAAPFNATLAAGMGEKAGECIRHCPTGALAWEHAKP
jgi:NADH dehydrogenase/NADH:ubiquinone oxidoreductase subunit G